MKLEAKRYSPLIIIILIGLTYSPTRAATAVVKPEMVKSQINEILAQPEFQNTREEYHWRYLPNRESISAGPEENEDATTDLSNQYNLLSAIAQLLEWLLWLSLGLGIIIIAKYAPRWMEKFSRPATTHSTYTATPRPLTQITFATMQLPTHLASEAWKLWQTGQTQTAMSLLYRGTLVVLTRREGLNISDSSTESECIDLLKSHWSTVGDGPPGAKSNRQPPGAIDSATELTHYFTKLTQTWQQIAYAQRQATDSEVQWLCEEWERYFG